MTATHKIDDLIPQDTKILIQEVEMKQEYKTMTQDINKGEIGKNTNYVGE